MRKVLLASVAAVGLLAAAGPAHAVDVVINGQLNNVDKSVGQIATFSLENANGSSVTSTVAAIGNSFALNSQSSDPSAAVKLDSSQWNNTAQVALTKIGNISTITGPDGGINATTAAIGNTLTGVADPTTGATGSVVDFSVLQKNTGLGQLAVNNVFGNIAGGADSSFTAAAIGNSVGFTAGSIGNVNNIDASSLVQINGGHDSLTLGQAAVNVINWNQFGGALSNVTAAAIGNSASVTTTTGDLALNNLFQGNFAIGGQIATNFLSDNSLGSKGNIFGTTPTVRFDASLTAAAVGNTATLASAGNLGIGDSIGQVNKNFQVALNGLDDLHYVNDLTLTTAAIGNSLSTTSTAASAIGGVFQGNFGGSQFAGSFLDGVNASGVGTLTTAAVGNTLSITAGSLLGTTSNLSQVNTDNQVALTKISGGNFGNLTATTAAIGNSATVTIK